MASDISPGTWTGIASCAVSCGCWCASALSDKKARAIQSARPIEHLSDLKELLHLLPLFVAVTGKAWAPDPLTCRLTDQKAVLVEYKEVKHSKVRNEHGTWHPQYETLLKHLTKTPWSIKADNFSVAVVDAHTADDLYLPLAETYIYADTAPNGTSTTSQIANRTMDALQGFKVMGTLKVEKALPVGTTLTIIGEVLKVNPGSGLKLQKPRNGKPFVISDKSLHDIVESYQQNAAVFKAAAVVFGGIGLAIFGTKLAQYGYFRWKERGIRRRHEEADRRRQAERQAREAANGAAGNGGRSQVAGNGSGGGDGGTGGGIDESGICVICLENNSDTIFQACGHLCTCSDCSERLNRCPICRTRSRAIRVYRT